MLGRNRAPLRSHLSFANVTSVLALTVAVATGGAYAANTIGGGDVIDESLTGRDVRGTNATATAAGVNGGLTGADVSGQPPQPSVGQEEVPGSLTTWDLADRTIRARDVAADALTGAQVMEGTLTRVPRALEADRVRPNGVGTAALQDGAVTRGKIALPERWRWIGDSGQPAFQNGWRNYDSAAAHKDAFVQHAAYGTDQLGWVHLRGQVKAGTSDVAFTLPSAWCPRYFMEWIVWAGTSSHFARVIVNRRDEGAAGCDVRLVPVGHTGPSPWVNLNVSWPSYELDTALLPRERPIVVDPGDPGPIDPGG